MQRKYLFLTLAALCGTLTAGVAITNAIHPIFGTSHVRPLAAMDLNTVDFNMRVEGAAFKYSRHYTSQGLVLNVTDGDNTDWHFGIANWEFPIGENGDYYCEFVMETNVNGADHGGHAESKVVLETEGGSLYFGNFEANTTFTVGRQFTLATGTGKGKIVLNLGALCNAGGENIFNVAIKKFVLKEGNSEGDIIHRINFESAAGFATRWKAAHAGTAFCDDKSNVEELIYDYCALREDERRALTGDTVPLEKDKNVFHRLDNGEDVTHIASNCWTNEYGAHCEVTSTDTTDRWRAGMFVNSGVALDVDHTYTVSFDLRVEKELKSASDDFDLLLKNQQWDGHTWEWLHKGAVGHVEQEIKVQAAQSGELFLALEMADMVNEITINNLVVTLKELDTDGKSTIAQSVEYFASHWGI